MAINVYNMDGNSNTCYTCGDDSGNMAINVYNMDGNSNTCYTCGDDSGNMAINVYNMDGNSNTCYTCGDDFGNMYVEPIINCDLNSPNTCYTCGDDLGNMYVEPKTTKTYIKPETTNTCYTCGDDLGNMYVEPKTTKTYIKPETTNTYIKPEIVSFYENNTLDTSFDFILYADLYPETNNFWKYFCTAYNIDDKHRLYFHYKKYYSDAAKNDTSEMFKCASFSKDHTVLYSKDIERILPINEMFVDSYNERTELGKEIAKDSKIAIVALARDCGDISLQDSINRVKSLCTNQTSFFVYENDSVDGTKDILKNNNIECISHNLNLESLQDRSYTRTERLANYRNVCLRWVKDNHSDADYVIVLDLDADLGFSIDGIYNSIYWLNSIENAGGMGSYSLYLNNNNYMHYDSFAARMNDWKPSYQSDHNNVWFKNWHPLVGSKPVQMYSCFGGLGVYKTDAFLGSKYRGELGSEHVDFHKLMQENGWDMYLNPSSRFFSVFNK